MKKLNIVFSFVLLSFCFLINVSFAEFSLTPMSSGQIANLDSVTASNTAMAGYTYSQIRSITLNHFSNVTNSDYESLFNAMVEALKTSGYSIVIVRDSAANEYHVTLSGANISVGARYVSSTDKTTVYTTRIDTSATSGNFVRPIEFYNSGSMIYSRGYTIDGSPNYVYGNYSGTLLYSSIDIKEIVYADGPTWDGSSYFYKVSSPDQPENPTMPTNAEIAQAVQAFYDSDYYKNNKDFKEFFVLYNSKKGIFSFIGHNCVGKVVPHFDYGSTLSQYVYSPNYPSNIYGLNYWSFNIETLGAEISNFFNNTYWLYSSLDNGETIIYNGQGEVTDLENLKFDSRYSTIIYSSTDYICRVFDYENNEETTTDAVIPGDQYTYDENLDPTTNEYNPITDFVPINPSETVLGNVDFDEINKTFEENKGILNIENASWLFTANNKLISYFIGFLSLLIVFLIISRALGG